MALLRRWVSDRQCACEQRWRTSEFISVAAARGWVCIERGAPHPITGVSATDENSEDEACEGVLHVFELVLDRR